MSDFFRTPRSKPNRRTRVALRVSDWPEDDRRRWEKVFAVGRWYDETGLGAHVRPATRTGWENAYGMWLGCLRQDDPTSFQDSLESRVTRERIKSFCERLAKTNSAISITTQLDQLRLALKLLSPRTDWSWLALIAKRVRARAVPRPKGPRQQEIGKLAALGFNLMDDAREQSERGFTPSLEAALKYRDGLMIAIEVATLLRRSNLSSMILGQHLARDRQNWSVRFEASEMKGGRPLHMSLPAELTPYIESYLARFRCLFKDADRHKGVWASAKGGALSAGAVYVAICARTQVAFGRPTNPHLFRDAGASALSIHAPEQVLAAADLLGHTSFAHTQKHYIRAQGVTAARLLAQALRERGASRRSDFLLNGAVPKPTTDHY